MTPKEREQLMLAHLAEGGTMSRRDLIAAFKFCISENTLHDTAERLQERGLVVIERSKPMRGMGTVRYMYRLADGARV